MGAQMDPRERLTWTISAASPANEVPKQVVGQHKEKTRVVLEQSVCGLSEAVQRELRSGQTSRFKETDENTALIGTDGLDYGNDHGRERDWERSFQISQRSRVLAVLGQFSPFKNVGSNLATCPPPLPSLLLYSHTNLPPLVFWRTGTVNRTRWNGI